MVPQITSRLLGPIFPIQTSVPERRILNVLLPVVSHQVICKRGASATKGSCDQEKGTSTSVLLFM